MKGLTIFAIGHSTRSSERFINILRAHSVKALVDIRTIPKSRHNPQFNEEELASALRSAGIRYVHMKNLGGLRHPLKISPNSAWKNASFRGYADYMQSREFEDALQRLLRLAGRTKAAIMCAEGNPFRCHRLLVADALTVRGHRVVHISSMKPGKAHRLTPFAKSNGTKILYPEVAEIEEIAN
jgi:uncharacterized protein (DUF488 family)